jgi:nicotinate phosphoribosyltransferase
VLKLSTGKKTLVEEKQVFRIKGGDSLSKDVISLRDEQLEGEPLLRMVMEDGRRQQAAQPLELIRDRLQKEFTSLDESHKALEDPQPYLVELSAGLASLQEKIVHRVQEKELGES